MSAKKIFKNKVPTLAVVAAVLIFGIVSALLSGCTPAVQKTQGTEGKVNIVATTTMLADLAAEIGGEHVNVVGLMGPGIDPHLYQASAGDVTKMQEADVVVYNGLHLEGKMGEVFQSLSTLGRQIICIEDGIDPACLLEDENNPQVYDPHIWFDVSIWKDAATHVAARLAEIDPQNKADYLANLEIYLTKLNELDEYIKTRIEELPQNQRVLVTAHDAFRYFGSAYGFNVMGLQGISTDAEAGTGDVSRLATFIVQNKIKAVFVESSVPAKNIEALQAAVKAQGFEVEIGGELYSDALGDQASGHNSYILTVRANIDTIVDALK